MSPRLSRREREVVERIVAGESYKEIAHAMGISVSAAGTYAQRAYEKIGDGAPRRHRRHAARVVKRTVEPEGALAHYAGQ